MEIDFDWRRNAQGFELTEPAGLTKPVPFLEKPIAVQRLVPRSGRWIECRPLDRVTSLYLILSHVKTAEDAVRFVSEHGPLTRAGFEHDGLGPPGEDVATVLIAARKIEFVLGHTHDRRQLASLLDSGGIKLSEMTARLEVPPYGPGVLIKLEPKTLLDGIWLQLGQALMGDEVSFRRCEHCGEMFAAGRGTTRRQDARFCIDEHRIAFHVRQRADKRRKTASGRDKT